MKVKVTCECEYDPDKKPIGVEIDMILEKEDMLQCFSRLGQVFAEKIEDKLEELKA
jgi:hypothetical protein